MLVSQLGLARFQLCTQGSAFVEAYPHHLWVSNTTLARYPLVITRFYKNHLFPHRNHLIYLEKFSILLRSVRKIGISGKLRNKGNMRKMRTIRKIDKTG